MTRTEHLLWILAEECAEVAQRASKAARFGLAEVQPEQDLNNADRLRDELTDLLAVAEMLNDDELIGCYDYATGKRQKREKVEKFLRYSAECGTLDKRTEVAP